MSATVGAFAGGVIAGPFGAAAGKFSPTSPQQAQTRKAFVTVTYFSCPSGAFQKGMKGGAACVAASAGVGAVAEMVYTKGQETMQTVFRSKKE